MENDKIQELKRVLFELSENVKSLPDIKDLPVMKMILERADKVLNS